MTDKIVNAKSKEGAHRHKGRVRTMRIERGENGVSVHMTHEPSPMSRQEMRSGMGSYEPDPPPSFFGKKKALVDHVMDHFGDVLGQAKEGDAKEEEPEDGDDKPAPDDED